MDINNKQIRDNFIKTLHIVRKELFNLVLAYESLNDEDNEQTAKDYPFVGSYDEWFYEFCHWVENLEKEWSMIGFEPTITVGDLKKILNNLHDSRQIVLGTKDWYTNIQRVQLPDDESTFTLTLITGSEFDTCQL